MSEKRRDKKGRLLREGESQRSDERYMYRYVDINGERKTEYSWRLVETDPHPKGKKKDLSLREKEKNIQKDMEDVISYASGKMTLNQLFDLYMKIKKHKPRTKNNYITTWDKNVRKRDTSNTEIRSLRKHHFIKLYTSMQNDGCGNGTIIFISKIINSLLNYACTEDYIRKNYAKGCMKDLEIFNEEREALTIKEQNTFLKYVASSETFYRSYWMFVFIIETMCRASELAGLTIDDLNLDDKIWDLNHQLLYFNDFYIDTPKTKKSKRLVPLSKDALKAISKQKEFLMKKGLINNYTVDECKNFLFLSPRGKLLTVSGLDAHIHRIVKCYNEEETTKAKKENREPFFLPDFTTHILRHTGCTRAAEKGIDARVLQDIMGHKDIRVTMKIYNHVDKTRLISEMEKLDKISEQLVS